MLLYAHTLTTMLFVLRTTRLNASTAVFAVLAVTRSNIRAARQGVVEDQAAKLMFSGLYHAASAIFCGVGAPGQDGAILATALLQSFGRKFQVLACRRLVSQLQRTC